MPAGLFSTKYRSLGSRGIREPSTSTLSREGSTLWPSSAVMPPPVTLPARMRSSHARREPRPAGASARWRRSMDIERRELRGLGLGFPEERGDRWERRERIEPQPLEELGGGPVQDRPARSLL